MHENLTINVLLHFHTVPHFRANDSWPESVKKEFSGQLHKFMASLTETANQVKGHTVLYLPNEQLDDVDAAAADKDLVQRLESTVGIALHCIALHCIALRYIAFIALRYIAFIGLHCIALHCVTLHCIALHCIALQCIALHCIALHCIPLHSIALHCIALHCIALHCVTLHCESTSDTTSYIFSVYVMRLCNSHTCLTMTMSPHLYS
jgi:hypothetical protein